MSTDLSVAEYRREQEQDSESDRSQPLGTTRGVCGGVGQKAAGWLQSHPTVALALPHPEEKQWAAKDIDADVDGPTLRRLGEWGVLKRVGRDVDGRCLWRTRWGAAAWIEHNVEVGDRFPCGHHGLRNIPDGGFTCLVEDCDREFPERVAREVFVR